MYSHCTVCCRSLGSNQILEPFPVGRRIAFDPFRGRLWALCGRCRNWSLAPLEERWEAVEAAERVFAGALVGASTGNIVLARAADGTELVRVGRTDRREFAAWRYVHRIRARQRRFWILEGGSRGLVFGGVGLTLGKALSMLSVAPAAYFAVGATVPVLLALAMQRFLRSETDLQSLHVAGERRSPVQLAGLRLVPEPDSPNGWLVELPVAGGAVVKLEGAEGESVMRRVLPAANFLGASRSLSDRAVHELARWGSREEALRSAAAELGTDDAYARFHRSRGTLRRESWRHAVWIARPEIRLALEMAVNDAAERRALDGELQMLAREWREAEEVAAVLDELLTPRRVRNRLALLRARVTGAAPGGAVR